VAFVLWMTGLDEIEKLRSEISKFIEKRNFKNNLKSV